VKSRNQETDIGTEQFTGIHIFLKFFQIKIFLNCGVSISIVIHICKSSIIATVLYGPSFRNNCSDVGKHVGRYINIVPTMRRVQSS
jgi:hypothetical protein